MLAADQRQKTIEGQYVRNLLTGWTNIWGPLTNIWGCLRPWID